MDEIDGGSITECANAILREQNDEFLLRYHPKTHFHRDSDASTHKGKDSQGRRYSEEWGWLGKPGGKKSVYVRRITLFRKDDEDVILVTSLLDADKYPATNELFGVSIYTASRIEKVTVLEDPLGGRVNPVKRKAQGENPAEDKAKDKDED